jgi:hypothetical protein
LSTKERDLFEFIKKEKGLLEEHIEDKKSFKRLWEYGLVKTINSEIHPWYRDDKGIEIVT